MVAARHPPRRVAHRLTPADRRPDQLAGPVQAFFPLTLPAML